MSQFANLYPGHLVVNLAVIVAAAVTLVSAAATMVSLFLERHAPVRHWVLLSALLAALSSPLLAATFIASGTSYIVVPLLATVDSPVEGPGVHGDGRPSANLPPWAAPEKFLTHSASGPAVARPSMDSSEPAQIMPAAPDGSSAVPDPFRSTVVAILLLWFGGIVVSIVGLARGGLFLYRLWRSMRPVSDVELGGALSEASRLLDARRSPTVMVSPLALTPMAVGLLRQVIVLPAGLPDAISREQLLDVLVHEFAHIGRRDNLIVLLQALAKATFWPILFVHLLNRQLTRAREDICDNHVLACRDAVSYGETLLRLAHLAYGGRARLGTAGIFHWRGKLEHRIFGLLHKGRSKRTRTHPIIAIGVLISVLSVSALLCTTTILSARAGEQNHIAAAPGADVMLGTEVGQERNDNGLKLQLVWCPPGKFTMGRQQYTKDQVEVTLTTGFWLGKYEVTQQEYQRIMGKNPSYFSAQGEGKKDVSGQDTVRFPVEQVSWDDAVEFCRKMTDEEHKAGRLPAGWDYTLPTEAQWEYACRAGTTTKYSFGDKLSAREARIAGDQEWALGGGGPDGVAFARTTTAVGSYRANNWGLCDMHGNAWEWVRDWYAVKLAGGTDPEGASEGQSRIYRGGGWVCLAYECYSALRRGNLPEYRYRYLGFRVALSPSRR